MLNVSIVLYHPNWQQVNRLCQELVQATCVRTVFLIDNSPNSTYEADSEQIVSNSKRIKYLWNNGNNLGYGAAHNIAIRESVWQRAKYHLVINADVWISASDLEQLYAFTEQQPKVGSLMPRVTYPDGTLQYLCKLLPTPLDVFGRRFLPDWLMSKRNERYELRATGYNHPMNVPYLSGCFMLLRTEAVLKAGLFDERYFMYPEDIDLTRTIHRDYLTLYYPGVTIIHDHAKGSYKNMHLLWVHIVNMCRYFNKWGWFFDTERRLFNHITRSEYGI